MIPSFRYGGCSPTSCFLGTLAWISSFTCTSCKLLLYHTAHWRVDSAMPHCIPLPCVLAPCCNNCNYQYLYWSRIVIGCTGPNRVRYSRSLELHAFRERTADYLFFILFGVFIMTVSAAARIHSRAAYHAACACSLWHPSFKCTSLALV